MPDLTGQRLGQYQILERVSRGATSTVYKAYQEKLDRCVAVKVLSPHFIEEEGFLERFHQEARAVARLDHPNILPVYDFDDAGDSVYIVMKYVNTGTLKQMLGRPLDLSLVVEIVTQVGMALGYAHRQGVIHRDVKPSNILMAEDTWALLTDFGLAKIRAPGRQLTKSGIGMGTPDYMAPEQAQGLPVDGRADLYSVGAMLYEMVTGCVPFDGESGMVVIVKHITEPVRPPRELNPNLPEAVEHVILKLLSKNPGDRYPTAEALVAALIRSTKPASVAASARPVSLPPLPRVPRIEAAPAKPPIRQKINRVWRSARVHLKNVVAHLGHAAIVAQSSIRRRMSGAWSGAQVQSKEVAAYLGRSTAVRWRLAIVAGGLLVLLLAILIVPGALQSSSTGIPTMTPVAVVAPQPTADKVIAPTAFPTSVPASPTSVPATPTATISPTLPAVPPGMVSVSAGSFTMGGVSGSFAADETPPHVVRLDPFFIDTVEVTNAQFARFADGSGYVTDAEHANDPTTWRNFDTPDRQRFPVIYVSWNDAVRYCAWTGKRLPTEAEWEKAARDATQRIYPWGDTFNGKYANTFELGVGQPVAVASNSIAGPYGAFDMVGNVWEWVQDWYGGGY
ncbi:MAG TPA: SUMF1/EgtB/PvdO family nonheme iron enzyme, partial [Anaerolineae bacterium]